MAQVIEELIQLAKDMRKAGERGEKLNLTDDEVAFYAVVDQLLNALIDPALFPNLSGRPAPTGTRCWGGRGL